jgi:hypothetical protein
MRLLTRLTPSDTGANASAEEADEGIEDAAVRVNNIVHSFRLQSTQFDKKSYLAYLKGYLKTVKAEMGKLGKSEEDIKEFESGAQKFVKDTLLPNFKDFEFFTGESMNPDGMYVRFNSVTSARAPACTTIADFATSGSCCSTTARMEPHHMSLSGSMVSKRPRCRLSTCHIRSKSKLLSSLFPVMPVI